jgi:intergrase/recombinase
MGRPKTTEDDYLSDIEKDLSQCIDGSSSEIRNSLLSPNFIASATEQMRVAQYIAHVEGNDLFQDRKPLRRFLLQELHRYEQAFADYLSHQVEHEVDYHDHAYKLYRTLSFDEFPGNDHFDCETSVLSFNYT